MDAIFRHEFLRVGIVFWNAGRNNCFTFFNLRGNFLIQGEELARAADSLFAAAGGAGFLDGLFNCFAGFARALLNPANQFFLLAFDELQIAIRELGPFLFQLALGDVPVAFDFECSHNSLLFVIFRFDSPPT
jgi:hypothetical protein